jgi:hypothetical protein
LRRVRIADCVLPNAASAASAASAAALTAPKDTGTGSAHRTRAHHASPAPTKDAIQQAKPSTSTLVAPPAGRCEPADAAAGIPLCVCAAVLKGQVCCGPGSSHRCAYDDRLARFCAALQPPPAQRNTTCTTGRLLAPRRSQRTCRPQATRGSLFKQPSLTAVHSNPVKRELSSALVDLAVIAAAVRSTTTSCTRLQPPAATPSHVSGRLAHPSTPPSRVAVCQHAVRLLPWPCHAA